MLRKMLCVWGVLFAAVASTPPLTSAFVGPAVISAAGVRRPAVATLFDPPAATGELSDAPAATEEWELQLFSPAKINLFLRILRKRPDGFHDLASLFQTVGFGDQLYFKALDGAKEDDFLCSMPGVPVDASNLVIRALNLFREKTGSPQYFKVFLDKRIPAQAGLGGGSGDAATALFAANELAGCPASSEDLVLWSAELGSDITFFLSRGTCYCTGRGEVLHPQQPMEPARLWLVKPPQGLSTPAVFKKLNYKELSDADPEELLRQFVEEGLDGATYINDLEPPAFRVMPALLKMKEELQAMGFKQVLMSGSGSTIFCLGDPSKADPAWPQSFKDKWGASIYDTVFINRPDNEHLWYKQEHPV